MGKKSSRDAGGLVASVALASYLLSGCSGESGSTVSPSILGASATLEQVKLVVASRMLTWSICAAPSPADPASVCAASRLLTDAEVAGVRGAVATVALSSASNCTQDAIAFTLDVKTPNGLGFYANDDFSSCPWSLQDGRSFVTGLAQVSEEMSALTTPCAGH
jgi:hypothetical protein